MTPIMLRLQCDAPIEHGRCRETTVIDITSINDQVCDYITPEWSITTNDAGTHVVRCPAHHGPQAREFITELPTNTLMHFTTAPDHTACGARVRVTGGTTAIPEHNCTQNLDHATCPECLDSTPRCPTCRRY